MTDISTNPKRRHRILPVVITLLVLTVVGVFVWRVGYYVSLIQSGQIVQQQAAEARDISISKLAAATATPHAGANVVTTDDPSLGSASAKITIVEFADFGCPYSKEESYVVRTLAQQYGDKVRFIYRDFPLTDLHPQAELAAEAGDCAQDQGKFWEMHDKMFSNQDDLSRDRLVQMAQELGLATGQFISCLDQGVHKDEVAQDYQDGLNAGVYGTPTFFINGNKVDGAIPSDVFNSLLKQATAS